MALKVITTNKPGNDWAMRERERVEFLLNLLAAQGFLSIADAMATT
jgi:hypothetical protein